MSTDAFLVAILGAVTLCCGLLFAAIAEHRRKDLIAEMMDEAERCERLAFLSRGHLIAVGTPASVTEHFGQPTIEDVFIMLQEKDEAEQATRA